MGSFKHWTSPINCAQGHVIAEALGPRPNLAQTGRAQCVVGQHRITRPARTRAERRRRLGREVSLETSEVEYRARELVPAAFARGRHVVRTIWGICQNQLAYLLSHIQRVRRCQNLVVDHANWNAPSL